MLIVLCFLLSVLSAVLDLVVVFSKPGRMRDVLARASIAWLVASRFEEAERGMVLGFRRLRRRSLRKWRRELVVL
ncbi:hypothetical protein BKA65DRAFT_505720, partial [Rhexocercosporidium sp. MPI-PUGE-AT-0058]